MNTACRIFCIGLFALSVTTVAIAKPHADWIYGSGTDSCGDWIANRASKTRSIDAKLELSWMLGWLSADGLDIGEIKSQYAQKGFHLKRTDANAVAEWLDNYCRTHPLSTLYDSTAALHNALVERN